MTRSLSKRRSETEKRRRVQPLFSALDAFVAPYAPDGVVLAVSGGADSVALLEAYARWRQRDRGHVVVASVDHGARPAAAEEVSCVLARARVLGFDVEGCRLTPSRFDEATLRGERYRALFAVAAKKGLHSICTAHHADDDAEGYLMSMVGLGGGKQGAAMPPAQAWGDGLWVLRPFVGLSRATLAAARFALGQRTVLVDERDLAMIGARALMRGHVLPVLRDVRPGVEARFAERARRAAEDESALADLAQQLVETESGRVWVRVAQTAHRSVARRALEIGIAEVHRRVYGSQAVERRASGRVMAQLLAASGFAGAGHIRPACFDLPGVRAHVCAEGVWLEPQV